MADGIDGSDFIRSHYEALIAFKNTESFQRFGFGRGGPHADWLQEVKTEHNAKRFNSSHRLAVGYLINLSSSYVTNRGSDDDFTKYARQQIELVIKNSKSTAPHPTAVSRLTPRTWTSSNGKFTVVAKYNGYRAGKVMLETADGTIIDVEEDKLSDVDKQWLQDRRDIAAGRR